MRPPGACFGETSGGLSTHQETPIMSGISSKWIALACASSLGLATSAVAQDEAQAQVRGPSTQAEMDERAYHNAQQVYLSGLQTTDGWYTMEGGLRWRYEEHIRKPAGKLTACHCSRRPRACI